MIVMNYHRLAKRIASRVLNGFDTIAVIKPCKKKDKDSRPAKKQRWCLYDHRGEKLLGRHPSKAKALKQEKAIQVRKHGG